DLLSSLRAELRSVARRGDNTDIWNLFDRWISEIVADFWAIARLGIGATQGLMAVVSLPRAFMFRVKADDPHPSPWIRVQLSCAMGRALFPDPQWDHLAALWESFYPTDGLTGAVRDVHRRLETVIPEFVDVLIRHRPPSLRGRALGEVMQLENRQPHRLLAL